MIEEEAIVTVTIASAIIIEVAIIDFIIAIIISTGVGKLAMTIIIASTITAITITIIIVIAHTDWTEIRMWTDRLWPQSLRKTPTCGPSFWIPKAEV